MSSPSPTSTTDPLPGSSPPADTPLPITSTPPPTPSQSGYPPPPPTSSSSAPQTKIRLHLKAVGGFFPSPHSHIPVIVCRSSGNAPILKNKNYDVEASKPVSAVQQLLRRLLKLEPADSLFIFVNQSFSPSPDHTIGTLHQCFSAGSGGAEGGVDATYKLTLHYSITQAWG